MSCVKSVLVTTGSKINNAMFSLGITQTDANVSNIVGVVTYFKLRGAGVGFLKANAYTALAQVGAVVLSKGVRDLRNTIVDKWVKARLVKKTTELKEALASFEKWSEFGVPNAVMLNEVQRLADEVNHLTLMVKAAVK